MPIPGNPLLDENCWPGSEYDVVVIGAGPAGALVARECARANLNVLLVEKSHFPRPKVCGCCLNQSALAVLEDVGLGGLTDRCGARPLQSVRLGAGRSRAQLKLPGGVALSRERFDFELANEARLAGAAVLFEATARVEDCQDANAAYRHIQIAHRGSTRNVRARVVVVATGLASRVESQIGQASPGSRLGAGVVIPSRLVPDFYRSGVVHMAIGRGGYVGLVRLEDDSLDLAAAFDPEFVRARRGLAASAAHVLDSVGWPAIDPLEERPWKGTPALTRRAPSVTGTRLFAIGDAAGYVEPFTGEGMAWALSSAVAVTPIIRRAVQAWNPKLARDWVLLHTRRIGTRQLVCRAAARVLRSPILTRFSLAALGLLPALARPVVAILNRPPIRTVGQPA